jgi:RNA polymerase sigma-70 factor (ECF subfamily)
MTREETDRLVMQAQQGNDRAFGKLFDGLRAYVCGYVLRTTGNIDDAEEIVQITFITAWHKIGNFNLEKATSFPAWLCGIAHNNYLKFREKRRGYAKIPRTYVGTECLNNLADGSNTPETSIIRCEETAIQDATVKRILSCADRLTQSQNLAFRLKYLEEMKTEDIQNITGMNPSQIRRERSRGIKKIRKYLN